MKLFKVESKSVAFDEDEFMMIIANTETRALEIALENWVFREGHNHINFTIVEINLSTESIVSISHYGD